MTPFAEELVRVHEEYARNVPNNYAVTIPRIAKALSERDVPSVAEALAGWLKNINLQYYRFRPEKARTLRSGLEPLLTAELSCVSGFRERLLTTLDKADEPGVLRLFGAFRVMLGPVGTAKALHVLAPTFFPMWDNDIASGYGFSAEASGYFQFMLLAKNQLMGLPADLIPGLSLVKAFDEYNYYKFSTPKKNSGGG
jgi:hypothetical protein